MKLWALTVATAVSLAVAWAAFASTGGHTIRVIVPVGQVLAREGTGVNFRSSYIPHGKSAIVRQDSFGIGTFVNEGLFLGAVTLHNGQIVYSGATANQDDFSYAILGGNGAYADARGTVTLHPISKTQVAVTIKTN
jgi:hypothetical protein